MVAVIHGSPETLKLCCGSDASAPASPFGEPGQDTRCFIVSRRDANAQAAFCVP